MKRNFEEHIKTFLILFFCFIVIFIIQYFRIITVFGIVPNFILLFFLLFPFLRFRFLFFAFCAVLFFIFTLFYAPFWLISSIALCSSVLFIYVIKRFLTGNSFVDFVFSIMCSTILFYTISFLFTHVGSYQSDFSSFISLFSRIYIIELLMNTIFGVIIWVLFKRMGKALR